MLRLLGLILLGQLPAQPLAPSPGAAPAYSYEVRFLDFEDLSWRASALGKLKSLEQRDGLSVWQADRGSVAEMSIAAQAGTDGKPYPAPRLAAAEGARAEVRAYSVRNYVAHCEPIESVDEKGASRLVSYKPEFAKLNDGCQVAVTGKSGEAGLKLHVAIEESRLVRLHRVKARQPSGGDISAYFQVPEVLRGHAEGEWTVPTGESLVVCLGAYTVMDDDGKSSTRERVVVITPRTVAGIDMDFRPAANK
mgnify:CR=1 FL=1